MSTFGEVNLLELNKVTASQDPNLLATNLEQLASYDFEQFVLLLYRVDIEEQSVREIMQKPDSFYMNLANMILSKLEQKKVNRHLFTYPDRQDDEDRW